MAWDASVEPGPEIPRADDPVAHCSICRDEAPMKYGYRPTRHAWGQRPDFTSWSFMSGPQPSDGYAMVEIKLCRYCARKVREFVAESAS